MNLLITGINGYLASNLARFLAYKGDVAVYGTVRKTSDLQYIEDIKDSVRLLAVDESYSSVYEAVKEAAPQIVFHTATMFANTHRPEQIAPLINANITFATHIAEASAAYGIERFVNLCSAYQRTNGEVYNPFNLYASLKQAFEDVLYYYTQESKLKVISLYLPHSYGKGDKRPKVLNLLRDAALSGERKFTMSAGTQELDILNVKDIVRGIWRAATMEADRDMSGYSLTSLNPITLKEIVERLIDIAGWDIEINWGYYPYPKREQLKYYKPEDILPGWTPNVSISEGLREFIS